MFNLVHPLCGYRGKVSSVLNTTLCPDFFSCCPTSTFFVCDCYLINIFLFFLDCSIPVALEAASLHPARVLGETLKGRLDFGADADIVFLSDDFTVHATAIAGEIVWESQNSPLNRI